MENCILAWGYVFIQPSFPHKSCRHKAEDRPSLFPIILCFHLFCSMKTSCSVLASHSTPLDLPQAHSFGAPADLMTYRDNPSYMHPALPSQAQLKPALICLFFTTFLWWLHPSIAFFQDTQTGKFSRLRKDSRRSHLYEKAWHLQNCTVR